MRARGLGDEGAEGGLVEVGKPAAVAHAVVRAQIEAEVEGVYIKQAMNKGGCGGLLNPLV